MEPIVIVDVGCRWGVESKWSSLPGAVIVGFDPDPEECERLRHLNPGQQFVPKALDSSSGKRTLYVTTQPACSSFYWPRQDLVPKYYWFCDIVLDKAIEVETTTLDAWTAESGLAIDFLKLDTQGSELDVLRGASRALEHVSMIETEVEFSEIYAGQPLFADVDAYLRSRGFLLWNLDKFCHYHVNGHRESNIGQLYWSQAYYVRRDLPDKQKACAIANAWGYPDLAEAIEVGLPTKS
jgi:FkbM family methyltransferase